MVLVLKSEGEAWGREGGVKVEAAAAWESNTGVGETDGGDDKGWGDRGHSTEWEFEFSDLIEAWHDSNDGLDENVTWRHYMTQALDLPLHEVITKSRVMDSGWSFMLIICASCE